MPNPWIAHVSKFRKSHPKLSMKQALKQAKASYTKVGKQSKKKVVKSKGKKKSK